MTGYALRITADGVLQRFANQLAALGEKEARKALQRGLAHTGNKAKTQVIRELTRQTGLRRAVIVRAVKFSKPSYDDLTYELSSRGGNISLKYFRPRETAKGVSAQPLGQRRVFPGTFTKAGWWPDRTAKPSWNGQVFRRTGGTTQTGMDEFEKVKSDVFIPDQMLKGATVDAWERIAQRDLAVRIGHEIGRLLPD